MADKSRDDFWFKVAHYGDQPEHFNAICGPPSLEIDAVRDELKANFVRSLYWKANWFDGLLAAIDVLPPLVEESDSSEESASDKEEENETGEGGGGGGNYITEARYGRSRAASCASVDPSFYAF